MAFWRQKHGWISLILSVVVVSLVLVSCTGTPTTAPTTIPTTIPTTATPQVIKWKAQSDFTATIPPYGPFKAGWTDSWGSIREWSDWVTAATKGGLTIDWAAPGAIYPPTEAVNAVGKGTVQAGVSFGIYYSGILPIADLLPSIPLVWETAPALHEALYEYGLYDVVAKAYAERNVKWLPWVADSIYSLAATFPISNPESFAGKKIRASGMIGNWLSGLGAAPVNIPITDTYMALKLGTVNGAMIGIAFLQSFAFQEVITDFLLSPKLSIAGADFLINMDAWNALPKDIRDVIELNSRYVLYTAGARWHQQNEWILANAESKYGVKTWNWSEADKKKSFDVVTGKVFSDFAAKDATCAKAIDIVKKQLKDYGKIK